MFRFGNPFILYLERTVTWDVLQKEILEKMRHLLRPGVFVQVHTLNMLLRLIQAAPLILIISVITFKCIVLPCLILGGL